MSAGAGPVVTESALRLRSAVLGAVRGFFGSCDFVEVETPVWIATPAQELHIDAPAAGAGFLRTSPELHMKRLLASGFSRIWQMGPCFRSGERGARHNPEFTMLEWYRTGADYLGILSDMQALIRHVVRTVCGGDRLLYDGVGVDVGGEWAVIGVRRAFVDYAGWDPWVCFDGDRFDLDMVEKVEPSLPRDRPVVLIDYPVQNAALARRKAGEPGSAERWELYLGGLELANAFSELTDAVEQRARFDECAQERAELGRPAYAHDERFLAALEVGLPACAGVALGVDRLVMLLAGASDIAEVRPFCGEI